MQMRLGGAKISNNSPNFRIEVGKDDGNLRYGVDYVYFGKIKDTKSFDGKVGQANYNQARQLELGVQSLGLNAYYDFGANSGIVPYVGGRVAINRLDLDVKESVSVSVAC